jgi:hypothetical protein
MLTIMQRPILWHDILFFEGKKSKKAKISICYKFALPLLHGLQSSVAGVPEDTKEIVKGKLYYMPW